VKCQLIDTAGIEDDLQKSDDATVEGAAAQMSQEQLRTADVRVLCLEAGSREQGAGSREQGVMPSRGHHVSMVGREGTLPGEHGTDDPLIVVLTKCDETPSPLPAPRSPLPAGSPLPAPRFLETSAVTGLGILKLKDAIRAAALRTIGPRSEVVVGTAVRCSESLRLAAAALDRTRGAVRERLGEELVAAELRVAVSELGKVAGAVYTDDLLDRIFSRFCIGK
jgi:tRNA modification GTPase